MLHKIKSRIPGSAVSILVVYGLSVILPNQQVFGNLEEDFSNARSLSRLFRIRKTKLNQNFELKDLMI